MQVQTIEQKIYEVRNQKVILDFDIASLYQVETRALKQSVKRNQSRFPKDFMFQLTKQEWLELITNCDNLQNSIKLSPIAPLAFTEQGVAMLSGILRSQKAVDMNIAIMRAFALIRQYALSHKDLTEKLNQMEHRYINSSATYTKLLISCCKKTSKRPIKLHGNRLVLRITEIAKVSESMYG